MTRDSRHDRAERRRRMAAAARERALRLSKPSPLPPHPEGLRPRVWPVLAFAGAVALSAWSWIAASIAVGIVLAYAIATRNDRKSTLLWAYIQGRRQFLDGDYEAALANFQDLEEADYAPPAVLRALGLTNYQLGQWAEAATYLEDVTDRTADEDAALAHSMLELGEVKEAADLLDALVSPPPLARVTRAVAALKLGNPAEAVAGLRALLDEAGGTNAPAEEPYLGARYWLGLATKAAGDETGARKVLSDLSDIDPGYHDVAAFVGRPESGRPTKVKADKERPGG